MAEMTPELLSMLEARFQEEAILRENRLRAELSAEFETRLQSEIARVKLEATARAEESDQAPAREHEERSEVVFHAGESLTSDRPYPRVIEIEALHTAPPPDEPGAYSALATSSSSPVKDDDARIPELKKVAVPVDMWGVAIMTLTRDMVHLSDGKDFVEHFTRSFYCLFCSFLNLGLQLAILYWINLYVVGQSVWNLQGNYAAYHHDVFDEFGSFDEDKWLNWSGPRSNLCSAALTKLPFLGSIVFLWCGRMMGELKGCVRLEGNVRAVPAPSSERHRINTDDYGDGEHLIVQMSLAVRVAVYVLVVLPKFIICIALMYSGCRWLTATESFSDLILNALALEFVVQIDENILDFFLPQSTKVLLETTMFAYHGHPPRTERELLLAMQSDYIRNIRYMGYTITLTVLFLTLGQQVLPDYKFDVGPHCQGQWFQQRFYPACQPFDRGCFPYGAQPPHDYGSAFKIDDSQGVGHGAGQGVHMHHAEGHAHAHHR